MIASKRCSARNTWRRLICMGIVMDIYKRHMTGNELSCIFEVREAARVS